MINTPWPLAERRLPPPTPHPQLAHCRGKHERAVLRLFVALTFREPTFLLWLGRQRAVHMPPSPGVPPGGEPRELSDPQARNVLLGAHRLVCCCCFFGGRGVLNLSRKTTCPSRHVCRVCDFTSNLCKMRPLTASGPGCPVPWTQEVRLPSCPQPFPHVLKLFKRQRGRTSETAQPKGTQSSWGHTVAPFPPCKLSPPWCGAPRNQ